MITHAEMTDRLLEVVGGFAEVHAFSDLELDMVPMSLLVVAVDRTDIAALASIGELTAREGQKIVTGRIGGRAFALGVVQFSDRNLSRELAPMLSIFDRAPTSTRAMNPLSQSARSRERPH